MKNILYLFWILFFFTCNKEEPTLEPITPIETTPIVDVNWATRIETSQEVVGASNQQVYKNYFLNFGDLDFPAIIYAHNTTTGDLEWKYEYSGWDNTNIDFNYQVENMLVCVTGKRVFGFDLDDQTMSWEINLQALNYLRGRGSIINGKVYVIADWAFATPYKVAKLLEIDPYTGEYEEVLSLEADEIGTKKLSPPCIWQDATTGQELMIVNVCPNSKAPPQETLQNIMAIDMATKAVVWETTNFTENFNSNSLHPPIIYKDIVITGGDWSIYAFDTKTGEQLWRYAFDYPWAVWNTTNHLIHDNRLYVNNGQFDITCLNPETGELIWNNPNDAPNCTDNMTYYNDMLVFTSWGFGSVMVIDALTGALIHREHRYENSSYNNDVVYDPITDMFFTTTYKHAVGFKVNKPE